MPGTEFPADMTVEQWDAQAFEDFVNSDWFKKFASSESNAMIHVKEDLVEKPGTITHFTLVNEVNADPLGQNDLYSGQEKQVVIRDQAVAINEYGQPFKYKKFEQKKHPLSLRQTNKGAMMSWNKKLHRDKIIGAMCDFYGTDGVTKPMIARLINGSMTAAADETTKDAWTALNADRVLFGANLSNNSSNDHSASLANIDSTNDKLTPDAIDLMKYMAKHPSVGKPKVRPIEPRKAIAESDFYVLFVHSLCMRDLRKNTDFLEASKHARDRGTDNPIFKGANYIWNNVAIYEIEEMPTLTGQGASGIDVGVCKLAGAQAIGQVWGKRPWTAMNSYENEFGRFEGVAIMQYMEIEKLRWGTGTSDKTNPTDHGFVTGYFSATAYA